MSVDSRLGVVCGTSVPLFFWLLHRSDTHWFHWGGGAVLGANAVRWHRFDSPARSPLNGSGISEQPAHQIRSRCRDTVTRYAMPSSDSELLRSTAALGYRTELTDYGTLLGRARRSLQRFPSRRADGVRASVIRALGGSRSPRWPAPTLVVARPRPAFIAGRHRAVTTARLIDMELKPALLSRISLRLRPAGYEALNERL